VKWAEYLQRIRGKQEGPIKLIWKITNERDTRKRVWRCKVDWTVKEQGVPKYFSEQVPWPSPCISTKNILTRQQSVFHRKNALWTWFVSWLRRHLVCQSVIRSWSWAYQETWASHVAGYQASNLFALYPSVAALPLYVRKRRDCPLFSQYTRIQRFNVSDHSKTKTQEVHGTRFLSRNLGIGS
jgi:hypothetical protein